MYVCTGVCRCGCVHVYSFCQEMFRLYSTDASHTYTRCVHDIGLSSHASSIERNGVIFRSTTIWERKDRTNGGSAEEGSSRVMLSPLLTWPAMQTRDSLGPSRPTRVMFLGSFSPNQNT